MADVVSSQPRILVFVVAYRAEKLIKSTLDRIPEHLLRERAIDVLIIDDASPDATAQVAAEWVRNHDYENVTVLRNPVNQGYGGNQKLGYRLAVEWGFDFVILLHGDGQYAPELLPLFIETYQDTQSDVIIGSRMQSLQSARAGGMPFYKIIGNRTLTILQNRLAGHKLSEWHSGYRGYSTKLLRKVPFEIDTNDFHFDTELLLQAMHVDGKFTEFPIPTHYGDEDCHVNGMKYAKDVMIESLRYRLHCMGILCSLRYQQLTPGAEPDNKTRNTAHDVSLKWVQQLKPRTLVDIGCGSGEMAQRCGAMNIDVMGLDQVEPPAGRVAHFEKVNLDRDPLPIDVFSYDAVLMLDVLEHLQSPESFLLALRNESRHITSGRRPHLILSTPNIAFIFMRINLLLGRFNYAERGILNIDHKRLFTKTTLLRLIKDCGYEIDKVQAIPAPFEVMFTGWFGKLLSGLARAAAMIWPRMFAFQWLVSCRPKPGIHHLLAVTERPTTVRMPLPAYAAELEQATTEAR